jgi:dipeptidyl aminopeptidase/acylaminoacyl peptidase
MRGHTAGRASRKVVRQNPPLATTSQDVDAAYRGDYVKRIKRLEPEAHPLDPGSEERVILRDKVVAYADRTGHHRYTDGPEWSPDGTKIFATGTSLSDVGSCCSRNVYVMDADGTNLQRLTNTPSSTEGEDFQATWAPDGKWLAFVSTRSEGTLDPDNPINFSDDREIYRMDADGTNEQQLTVTTSR